jgi:hypothetical protein
MIDITRYSSFYTIYDRKRGYFMDINGQYSRFPCTDHKSLAQAIMLCKQRFPNVMISFTLAREY